MFRLWWFTYSWSNRLNTNFSEKYKQRESYESKYSAEEKVVREEESEDEDFQRSVSERRDEIQKRLTRTIPASAQRVEIVEEITNIKRQSLVEDKIAEVEQKSGPEVKPVGKTTITTTREVEEAQKTTMPSRAPQVSEVITTTTTKEVHPDSKTTTVTTVITRTTDQEEATHNVIDKRDTQLLQSVSEKLETDKRTVPRLIAQESGELLSIHYSTSLVVVLNNYSISVLE